MAEFIEKAQGVAHEKSQCYLCKMALTDAAKAQIEQKRKKIQEQSDMTDADVAARRASLEERSRKHKRGVEAMASLKRMRTSTLPNAQEGVNELTAKRDELRAEHEACKAEVAALKARCDSVRAGPRPAPPLASPAPPPAPPLRLPCTSPAPPLHLPCISPAAPRSPLHLPGRP